MAENGRQKGDDALLLALAGGRTVRDAATVAGIGERTVYRRLEDIYFRRRLHATRSELVGRAVGLLADASSEAVSTLKGLLSAQSESVRLGAARSILEIGNRLRESVELEQRLAELEQKV